MVDLKFRYLLHDAQKIYSLQAEYFRILQGLYVVYRRPFTLQAFEIAQLPVLYAKLDDGLLAVIICYVPSHAAFIDERVMAAYIAGA